MALLHCSGTCLPYTPMLCMTVKVRTAPSRIAGNSIRPFQAVRPANNVRPYTLKTWKPPVPEPLPPAPLLGIPSLLAIGALVFGQLWGLLAGPDRVVRPEQGPGNLSGSYNNGNGGETYVYRKLKDGGLQLFAIHKLTGLGGSTTDLDYRLAWTADLDGDGTYEAPLLFGADKNTYSGWYVTPGPGGDYSPTPAPGTEPVEVPYIQPEPITPASAPEGLPSLPAYSPATSPVPVPAALPGSQPLIDPLNPQPATAPTTSPGIRQPLAPPLLRPSPAGTTVQPVTPYLTAAAPSVSTTPAGVHYPAPNIPIPANPPAPTLKGIAQEVGRVESKLNKLLNPATGNNFDRLELIYDTISGLFEFLTSITAGGSYTLEAPCETAEDGSPLVVEHTYGGAVNSIGVLSNKIDALAAMLQTVKNQKQPVCKAPPRQGQAVTVNFEEV